MMDQKEFLSSYLSDFSLLVKPDLGVVDDLVRVANILEDTHLHQGQTFVCGNGGSAAVASHITVDLTKNAKLRCMNFNETSLITCLANDFGYERWLEKAIEFYGQPGDSMIAISSSGRSENVLNAVAAARRKQFRSVITLTGFSGENTLRQLGDLNLWIDSRAYNFVENVHQVWLTAVVDLIIGTREYPA